MQVTVRYNKLLIAPRKLRAVLPLLLDRKVPGALEKRQSSPRATTEPIVKLLKASISAAHDVAPALKPSELRVAEVYCKDAARAYRMRLRGRGRSSSFAKRGSHLTLTVAWSDGSVTQNAKRKTQKLAQASSKT